MTTPTPEPGGTPGTPGTASGRRLVNEYRAWFRLNGFGDEGWDPEKSAAAMAGDIAAIEEEARGEAARSERERLRVMFDEEGCQAVYGDLNPEIPE